MLPAEDRVAADIATRYRAELESMSALTGVVMEMLKSEKWTTGRTPRRRLLLYTVSGLLAKACKTARSIEVLCGRGLTSDGAALVRVLFETAMPIAFILQNDSVQRLHGYFVYCAAQDLKKVEHQKRVLKRHVPARTLGEAKQRLRQWESRLPRRTEKYKNHWSGLRGLEAACRTIRGAEGMYATLYRSTSSSSHAADLPDHLTPTPLTRKLEPLLRPSGTRIASLSLHTSIVMWELASLINRRFKLGFGAALDPLKPRLGRVTRKRPRQPRLSF